ncbi:hypothetical protein VRRI112168_02535 [Vreelandella rituensis]|uniref:Uncharacterized protein n=1 Tax=Vreelandella rituensis TaxID=2282306 RepID=A0A368U9N6_9GAMM|nr:hypothetical protein [Halomonas rituensis]RCV93621.1 hypothetical protein DU506_00255 [Halomonas rituensis]
MPKSNDSHGSIHLLDRLAYAALVGIGIALSWLAHRSLPPSTLRQLEELSWAPLALFCLGVITAALGIATSMHKRLPASPATSSRIERSD